MGICVHPELKKFLNTYKFYFLSISIIALLGSIFKILYTYKIKEIIDTIALDPNRHVGILIALFALYKLLYHGMFFIRRLFSIKYDPSILVETVESMYTQTIDHSLNWFDSHLSGEISSKIADFQSSVNILIIEGFLSLNNLSTVLISLLFLFQINIESFYVLLFFILFYAPILFFLLKKEQNLQGNFFNARQKTLGILNDSISNIFGIKIIGTAQNELEFTLRPALSHWKKCDKKIRKFDAYFVDNADTILATIMGAVQIYVLSILYQNAQITAGEFTFIALISFNIHTELQYFLDGISFKFNPAIATLKASYSFLNVPKDTKDIPHARILQDVRGEIHFDHVSFSYTTQGISVFNDLTFHIPAYQKIGIVGPSGAGKTTLIKCLMRYFDPSSGAIFIDSHSILDVTQESLRAHLSVIPQDIVLFHRSILDNLRIAQYTASMSEIVKACKKAHAHEFISQLPDGYNTLVGERGVKLSGGQRQRIAIARAIIKNAPILILDEATSALDTPTEHLIQDSIDTMLKTNQATTIVIAHRLSTLLHMDRIIVLNAGKIVEDGTHLELLTSGGLYKTLWDAQVGGFLS